eukprot:4835600-Pyramimonas_sp.AAC.1
MSALGLLLELGGLQGRIKRHQARPSSAYRGLSSVCYSSRSAKLFLSFESSREVLPASCT